jgi:hypothetical protein
MCCSYSFDALRPLAYCNCLSSFRGIIKFKALCRIDQQQQRSGKPKGVPDIRLALVLEYAKVSEM